MKAALYILHYIHSTHDYGISFSSRAQESTHMYLYHPDESDTEAFSDAVPHNEGREHHLTTYSGTCWGSQIGNAVCAGTMFPLFKFHNISGTILYHMGGHIAWKAVHQEHTSLYSCDAKI